MKMFTILCLLKVIYDKDNNEYVIQFLKKCISP